MYLRARKSAYGVAVALLSVNLAACDIAVQGNGEGGLHFDLGARAQDEWTRTYKVSPGARLELLNVNGKISAAPAAGDAVELTAERTAKATSEEAARAYLERLEMREEASDARVRVEVRPPSGRNGFGHEIKWTVRVPKGVTVDLRTSNGGVELTGLDGDVRARSTNGGIKGYDLRASNVDAAVTNGGVEIELARAPTTGSIDLESVNGGISLALPADSKADISARCVNGGISVIDLPVDVIGDQNRRRLEGKLNGGGARVTLETTNGGVKISRLTT